LKRVLIISPYFPPSNVAGVHRARLMTLKLKDHGWEPVVLTVDSRDYQQHLDHDLLDLVAPDLDVRTVRAWPAGWSSWVGLTDASMRGYRALKKAAMAILADESIDAVFVTVLPGFILKLVKPIEQRFKIPVIVDYQDPWLPANYVEARFASKSWLAFLLARLIEPSAIRHCCHITAVSRGTYDLVMSRHSSIRPPPFTEVPIGTAREDFERLDQMQRPNPWMAAHQDKLIIAYIGNVWPGALETLKQFLTQLLSVLQGKQTPYNVEDVHVLFTGTSNQTSGQPNPVVLPLLEAWSIDADVISEYPERLSYLDAMNLMRHSTINLIIGSNDAHYSASKIYPMILAGRPIFSVLNRHSSAADVLARAGGGIQVLFDNDHPISELGDQMGDRLQELLSTHSQIDPPDTVAIEPFLADHQASCYADVFNRALAG